MTNIIDFENCQYSNRHGSYAGMDGNKDGIIYNNEPWIIKYPKSTKFMQTDDTISYVSSALSEYIGSHIYQILGFDTHQTELGIRGNKIIVACKDFCQPGQRLFEMKTIKNAANKELADKLEQELHHSSTGDRVNLNEMILHLELNPLLKKTDNTKNRFWDMAVIDVLIDNSDRNNGNWGIIFDENNNTYQLAPVYDNGNAFTSKASDNQIAEYLKEPDIEKRLTGGRTAYDWNGKLLSAKKLLRLDNNDLYHAIQRNIPIIQKHLPEIYKFIQEIPNEYNGKIICSDIRKEYYTLGIKTRMEQLLEPADENAITAIRKQRIAKTENK